MEFWSELLTRASWEGILELKKKLKFVLIGGWAVYLHTSAHKSKDIDILLNYNELWKMGSLYDVKKNDRLHKYEVSMEKFDIDIYLPHFSKLAIPIEDLLKEHAITLKGIKTINAESLLILKQGAEIERRHSVKGRKDAIDILTLLIHGNIDLKKYALLLKRYKKENYAEELTRVIRMFDDKDIPYLNIDFVKYKRWKKDILKKLKGM